MGLSFLMMRYNGKQLKVVTPILQMEMSLLQKLPLASKIENL